MSDCFICVSNNALQLKSRSQLRANAKLDNVVRSRLISKSKINITRIIQPALVKLRSQGIGKIRAKAFLSENVKALESKNTVTIKAPLKINGVINSRLSSKVSLKNSYVDKFAGHINEISSIKNFSSVQKLYPISDKVISLNNSSFVDKNLSSGNLYQSIDEGVYVGNYNENLNSSNRLSDDNISFIQPSSIFTNGTFRYKCEVSRPYHHPKNSFLFIRASAPLSNYGSNIPPEYRIHNIKLEDPSGNLIIKYKEIRLRGDSDYSSNINYCTYITEPEINNANLHSWQSGYPLLGENSGYTLNMDFDTICLDDPFNTGFDTGYEEKVCEIKVLETSSNDYLALDGQPLSTQTQGYVLNPTNTLRISAIEICNSGSLCSQCSVSGIKLDNYFGFYTEVGVTGQRLSRTILPSQLLLDEYNVDLYPETYSTWLTSPNIINSSPSGANVLLSKISNTTDTDFITLVQSSPVSDSGRLTLKFSHQPPQQSASLTDGSFDFSTDNAFDRAELKLTGEVDSFFLVDSIELKVIAKKAIGSRNYVLDVVGYSDDKILNVTPKIGGFLQNTQIGSGTVPLNSGFYSVDDFGISSESISDKSQYYEKYLTSIDAGDHYKLSSLPVIDSTSFQEYTIPLSIYEDYVTLGKSKDYSMSSYFENLFIDLYPIPSGASISNVRLVVHYRPSNAVILHTFGTPSIKELGQTDIRLLPIGRNTINDVSINSDADDYSLSLISGVPHSYTENSTLKTNYARRWRGVDGNIVNGPYDPNEFDFSYYNPQSNHPFLNGFYNLNHTSGNFILSDDYSSSGYYNGQNSVLKNIGWRFNNSQLFQHSTPYTTIDWANGDQPLSGIISDAFDSAIKVSGLLSNINFGEVPLDSGFALYLRFTPDIGMSGYNNPLFNSGVLISKWDSGQDLGLTVGYKNGYLNVLARDNNNSIIELNDPSPYDSYQYPLSLLVTYNHALPSGSLRLYCNNEIANTSYLRDTTSISISGGNSDLVFGYSYGSGIGSNIYIHEVGISSSGNIVNSSPNRLFKQTTASDFLDGISHTFDNITWTKFKLHQYIDEDTSSWKLGAYKICSFSPDFDGFTTRIGKDYLIHQLKHSGSGYAQITNLPLPSSVIASGLSYHTQIENDFLRFNLQDIPDANPEFYAVLPRICKTLPRDYNFTERAFAVDTVIEHETNNNILWPDNNIGPKLIVSLYSKNQNPIDRPSKVNWGLINRSIHYLEPSGCYEKISSTFKYNDLIDISEPWAKFDLDRSISEFDHKYYSTDINDMFLQYDLVYPSGSPFESTIKIHSANVRLEKALTYWAKDSNQFNLYTSGESISYAGINLYNYGRDALVSELNLYTSGSPWSTYNDNIGLFTSGTLGFPYNQFNLFVKNSGVVSVLGPNIYVSGGQLRTTQNIPLVMIDNSSLQTRTNSLPLHIENKDPVFISYTLPLFTNSYSTRDIFNTSSVNLFTKHDEIIVNSASNNFNLYINTDLGYTSDSGSFNLFTINYLAFNQNVSQQSVISWNKNNVGTSIDAIIDADVPYLEANDEIRGVDLLCFGECDTNKNCKEVPLNIHDIDWYEDLACIDGGIFRPKSTYTNLSVSGFKTPTGYNGHFYGIRKYDGLTPNAPYNVTISAKAGKHEPIQLPTRYTELNYGSNDYVNYSGIKLTSNNRETGGLYGKSVSVKKDLMGVGSPMETIPYSEYDSNNNLVTSNLDDAGCVYVYRRSARPSGYTWPENEHRSDWNLETRLTLPSGLLKDYPTKVKTNVVGGVFLPSQVTLNYWNVGQEGRQFGHSLDIGINENIQSFQSDKKEVIVVGGPSSKWTRNFEDLATSGVSIGLIIFTDEFVPAIVDPNNPKIVRAYQNILESIAQKDLVFRYFSDPPVNFNVKLIICEPLSDDSNITTIDFPEPKPSFIVKKRIPRNIGIVDENDDLAVFSGIKSAFEEAFPYDNTKLNNNIPVMLGVYVDNSRSLGRSSVTPGLDSFLSYYESYSFASGLRDFYNVRSSGAYYEYTPSIVASEDWITLSQTILDSLLDTGRLVSQNQVRFFSSGVGEEFFNTNLSQFNYAPPSGGRVYIFEKESGSWNLIQEIQSPVVSYDTIDRFGHAVAISEDTNIVAVGSPYINDCCKIYEHKPLEKQKLYNNLHSWLVYKNTFAGGLDLRYSQFIEDYDNWLNTYGYNYANQILYSKLTSTEKFEARKYLNIQEYENVFTYSYKSIPYSEGNWSFIPEKFAPSSRLGYSVAINDDGSTVAFGAPTDSFNVFDDMNVYYKNDGYLDPLDIDNINGTIMPSWRSNVNAGAVRLFESRDYYPHSGVVEFGKFGNLQSSLIDPLDSGHFDYLSTIFQNRYFRKMNEDEVEIPQDAGLAFIITPAEDAASEEIIDNIISWLSLGDRNLVLVGNDPVWEASGAYATSNTIINKILDALNSKMRLYPARNINESLPSGKSLIVPSFKPEFGTPTYVQSYNINTAYGVGDIRMHFPGFVKTMPCTEFSLNNKCELPLIDKGDLRAQWYDSCSSATCGFNRITYAVNWPFIFKTFTPQCCSTELIGLNEDRFDLEGQDPVPILAAGETKTSQIVIPAVPARFINTPIYENKVYFTTTTVHEFDETNISNTPIFIWNSGNNGYSSYDSNINNVPFNTWYRPELYGDRQSLLQASSSSFDETIIGNQLISEKSLYCVEQSFGTSSIIGIAGVETESQTSLLTGAGDLNVNFYLNMVAKDINGSANIAQLGGWTGRNSFTDAYQDSILYDIFRNGGNDVYLNVINLSVNNDICWIANPVGLPSDSQLQQIKSWLNLGNKKIIITHDNTIIQVQNVSRLFELLDTNIKPIYLNVKDAYAKSITKSLVFNTNHPVSIGFGTFGIQSFGLAGISFIPFSSAGVQEICYGTDSVYDDKLITNGYWRINSGLDRVIFPVIPGSGYKLFIDTVSETPSENRPIEVHIKGISQKPSLPFPDTSVQYGVRISDYNLTSTLSDDFFISNVNATQYLVTSTQNKVVTTSLNFQIPQNVSGIEIYLNSFIPQITTTTSIPKTIRILAISGVPLPIKSSISQIGKVYQDLVGYDSVKVSDPIPETIITQTTSGQIVSLNDNYCFSDDCYEFGLNNQLIADGPVVVAQEVESVSSFSAGVARSRITLISDSSLVQGRFMSDEFGRMSPETVAFINSLYPQTNFPLSNAGKQYISYTKIVSPERGSPQKYFSLENNSGSRVRFGDYGSSINPVSFSDKESLYDPKYVVRSIAPWGSDSAPENVKKIFIDQEISAFESNQLTYGATARFSGIIDGTMYTDIGILGGIPQIMKDSGYDYLDFDKFPSGYPGDLFGFSVSLHKNKLLVGSPYSAFTDENINRWLTYVGNNGTSGVDISYNGGAGSAYVYEKTFNGSGVRNTKLPWEFMQKLRPTSINVGHDLSNSGNSQSYLLLGPNPYTNSELIQYSSMGDQFGYSVSIDSDIIAVGAPGHDFGSYSNNIYNSGSYIRKAFNNEFDIPSRVVIDLGNSGIRNNIGSGQCILNAGAIFTFENSIIDWPSRTQKWSLIEKIIPQGSGSSSQSNNKNDMFGRSVSVHRSNRSDADYTIVGGSENHDYSISGNNMLSSAGAVYSNDIMLRDSYPAFANTNSYIDAKVFGERDNSNNPTIRLVVPNSISDQMYYGSGIIYTDKNGAIFLEASGQDLSQRGFISHRPYIVAIDGLYYYGTQNSGNMPLFVDGNIVKSENMNLFVLPTTGNVYNNIGLYNSSIVDFGSGTLNFYTNCPDPTTIFASGLNLFMASGIGTHTDTLNMRIRGY